MTERESGSAPFEQASLFSDFISDFEPSRPDPVPPPPQAAKKKVLLEPPATAIPVRSEPEVYSVSDINKLVRKCLEGEFPLIWLKGEISNFKAHTSGHYYFTLKDKTSQIAAVMFKGFNAQLKFRPADGMEVLVRGKVTVYEAQGKYQIFCELMEPVGAGALQRDFERLKLKLQSEGLFAPERKRALPDFPRHIAIVTSPTGAAIRDMMNVLARRNRGVRITIVPCRVQGKTAAKEIVSAIEQAERLLDADVMIVGRGGGSIEDLWCFNEEIVARAVASCKIPVISAVGHEIDFTICDFVADVRAPTPSAAAELVVRNMDDIMKRLNGARRSLQSALQSKVLSLRKIYHATLRGLIDPRRRLQEHWQRNDELSDRLHQAVLRSLQMRSMRISVLTTRLGTPAVILRRETDRIEKLQNRLQSHLDMKLKKYQRGLGELASLLHGLSPLRVLDRGYSLVQLREEVSSPEHPNSDALTSGPLVTDSRKLRKGARVTIRFAHGSALAEIKELISKEVENGI